MNSHSFCIFPLQDWDLFNHMSYVRVSWIPVVMGYSRKEDQMAFLELVKHELDIMERENKFN
jgi:hypothetical protein